MQPRIALTVTLALVGVAAAIAVVGLAHRVARRVTRYLDSVEGFAAALTGCPPVAAQDARRGPFVR